MARQIESDRDIAERDAARPVENPRPITEAVPLSRERETVRDRGRIWRISEAERHTLSDIGRFRTIAEGDLLRALYKGDAAAIGRDLASLAAQGLVQRRHAWINRRAGQLDVVVLTKHGKNLLECDRREADGQALYAGFVKPSEVAHDAAIYRMFQAEAASIAKQGGRITRVVLDYELKRNVYSPLAKARHLAPAEFAARQKAVAHQHGLHVIRGHVILPDLRIEYETRDGAVTRVDLELATEHYHGSHLRDKADAGFRIYVADGSASRLTRVLEEREITAAIFSL